MGLSQSSALQNGPSSKFTGYALILNFMEFPDPKDRRNGTEIDCENLEKLLTQYGFTVKIRNDFNRIQVINEVNYFATNEDHSKSACVLVIVLTHGLQDGKLSTGTPEQYFYTREIWQPFVTVEGLKDVPKIFIFQACRGDLTEIVVKPSMTPEIEDMDEAIHIAAVPHRPNFLLAFSTVENHFSLREPTVGTWYIRKLHEVLSSLQKPEDILDILTEVTARTSNKRVSKNEVGKVNPRTGQTPTFISFLNQRFMVPPLPPTEVPPPDPLSAPKTLSTPVNDNSINTSHDDCSGTMLEKFRLEKPLLKTFKLSMTPEINKKDDCVELVTDATHGTLPPAFPSYQWTGTRRSRAFIFYTDVDFAMEADQLENSIINLNFNICKQYKNPTEITEILNNLSKDKDLKDESCLLVAVIGKIQNDSSSDKFQNLSIMGDKVSEALTRTWTPFLTTNCPFLANKPKIFFFLDPEHDRAIDGPTGEKAKSLPHTMCCDSVTNHADFLYVYGYGRASVQALCEQLRKRGGKEAELLSLLTAAMKVASLSPREAKTAHHLIHFESTLRYRMVLQSKDSTNIATVPEDTSASVLKQFKESKKVSASTGIITDALNLCAEKISKLESTESTSIIQNNKGKILAWKNTEARVFTALADYKNATRVCKQVIQQTLDENFNVTPLFKNHWRHAMYTLADILQRQKETKKALLVCNKMKSNKNVRGPNNAFTLDCLHQEVTLLMSENKFQKAHTVCKELLAENIAYHPSDHEDILTSKELLARILFELKIYKQALNTCEEVIKRLEKRRSRIGANHESTLRIIFFKDLKAHILEGQGEYNKALDTCKDMIEERKTALGAQHGDTLESIGYKAALQKLKDDKARANIENKSKKRKTRAPDQCPVAKKAKLEETTSNSNVVQEFEHGTERSPLILKHQKNVAKKAKLEEITSNSNVMQEFEHGTERSPLIVKHQKNVAKKAKLEEITSNSNVMQEFEHGTVRLSLVVKHQNNVAKMAKLEETNFQF